LSETEITYSQSEQVNELVAALAKAKLKYGEVVKSKENKYTGSLYADLQDLMNAAERPLAEEGLVIVHFPIERIEQKKAGALTKLIHASGQFFGNQFLMPATGKASGGAEKLDAQTVTGGVTYAKRCNYGALAGLVGEADDDGNALADKSSDPAVKTPPAPKTVKTPPVNQAKANTGGERPNSHNEQSAVPKANLTPSPEITSALPLQRKAVEPPTPQPAATQTNDPSFNDVVPVQAAFPLPDAVYSPEPPFRIQPKSAQDLEKPTKSQLDTYTAKVRDEIRPALERAGLKASKNATVGAKLKNYLVSAFGTPGAKDLTDLTVAQWDAFLNTYNTTDSASFAALVEGGNK
jgi:hypothetical protein